mmetsp:Transcript_17242/g.50058  ORF Transcript_17242/g.50058 Transcript_17242/m.50058 type:complete len:106 (+) Transcript_17242:1091-1408(+)
MRRAAPCRRERESGGARSEEMRTAVGMDEEWSDRDRDRRSCDVRRGGLVPRTEDEGGAEFDGAPASTSNRPIAQVLGVAGFVREGDATPRHRRREVNSMFAWALR